MPGKIPPPLPRARGVGETFLTAAGRGENFERAWKTVFPNLLPCEHGVWPVVEPHSALISRFLLSGLESGVIILACIWPWSLIWGILERRKMD